jgi:hypothetical protein
VGGIPAGLTYVELDVERRIFMDQNGFFHVLEYICDGHEWISREQLHWTFLQCSKCNVPRQCP